MNSRKNKRKDKHNNFHLSSIKENYNPVSRQGDRGSHKNKSAKGTNRASCKQRKKDLKQGNDLTLFVPLMLSWTNEQEELMKRKERTRGLKVTKRLLQEK